MHRTIADDQHHRDNPVIRVFEAMRTYVEDFEGQLDDNHEVGVRLVAFGSSVLFHAQEISFSKPSVIAFKGITPEGDRVQLIQHVSQLNFLLKSVPKLQDSPRRIGFVWSN